MRVLPPRSRAAAIRIPALVAVSHGTSSTTGRSAVAGLVEAVRAELPGVPVRGGFVDVQQPDVAASLESVDASIPLVVVPLLLSAGYHVHVDLTKELKAARDRSATLAAALGPDDRLVSILRERLIQAGLCDSDRVVLACAGSSDARAVDDCHETGERLSRLVGRPVRVGFISAASPRLADAVESEKATAAGSRVVVSTYLLAPGYFSDLADSTNADTAAAPLLVNGEPPPPGLVELVVERYREAVGRSALS